MAFTFRQSASNSDETTIVLTVLADSLIVIALGHLTNGTATSCTVSDGTTSFTMGTVSHDAQSRFCQFGYLLSANAGTKTYTVTFSNTIGYYSIMIYEFTHSATISFDVQAASATGSSTTPTSANITTTGTSEVAFGGAAFADAAPTLSLHRIDSVAADGIKTDTAGWATSWYRILSAIITAKNAVVTTNPSVYWAASLIAFKEAAGGLSIWQSECVGSSGNLA